MKVSTTHALAFDFNGRNVRSVHIHGQPWFVGKDLCEILGIKDTKQALGSLERGGYSNDPLCPLVDSERMSIIVDTLGGPQKMVCVNESGLYALIFKSRKPEAIAFRRWVTNEVLPALRKTGFYALGRGMMEDRANWELSRCRGRMALLKELQDLERDPKSDLEYLTVFDFLERQGIKLENRTEALRFCRQVQMCCQQIGEYPVKQYRRRNRIPATLWPEPVLRQCLSLLPPAPQPQLALS